MQYATVRFYTDGPSAPNTESDKVEFIYKFLTGVIKNAQENRGNGAYKYLTDYHTYLVGVPLIVVIIAIVVVMRGFYPKRVFLWGDWEEHYNGIVSRRKFLWQGVVVALLIGIIGNLVVLGITSNITGK